MSADLLSILLVEDDISHAELIKRSFELKGKRFQLTVVHTLTTARIYLEKKTPDLILVDFMLPDGRGIDLLPGIDHEPDRPIIIMTSHGDEQVAVEAMKAGALDYIVKSGSTLVEMPHLVERALREWNYIIERRQTERALHESEERFRSVIEQSTDGIVLVDEQGMVVEWNNAVEFISGVKSDEAIGKPAWDTYFAIATAVTGTEKFFDLSKKEIQSFLETGKAEWLNQLQDRHIKMANGSEHTIQQLLFPITTSKGHMLGGFFRDVTQIKQTEQQLRQQDRLAAIGQLAAGIAHDFNNIMAVIVLYAQTSLLTETLPIKVQERLGTIVQQAQRATDLIQQILDFSRRTVLERRPLSLIPLLKEQVKLLDRTMPENINIRLRYGEEDYSINADPTRIQQAIMNLMLNARDSMPEGGNCEINLQRLLVNSEATAPVANMHAGMWVQLSIADTGIGIPDDVLPHLFEPFFTTKAPGKGTGLGLAQVYGIVRQHEGHVDVQTRLGQGTTFTIYIPALKEPEPSFDTMSPIKIARGNGETLLVVEDNYAAREALLYSLELLDYRTIAAQNGLDALLMFEELGDEIKLIISDVVMPEMGGITLIKELRKKGVHIPVVMLTGHPMEDLSKVKIEENVVWVHKPPQLTQLSLTLHNLLHGKQKK